MSQELYKRNGHNWKDVQREESYNRSKDSRLQYIMDHFRKIDLKNFEEEDFQEDWGSMVFPIRANNTPRCSVSSEDDWENPIPRVDLRTYNFTLPGILCPFCRDDLMKQDVNDKHLSCKCGGNLQCQTHIDEIKGRIEQTVGNHSSSCPSNQSPEYTMFKSNIVLTCSVCKMVQVVS